MKTGVSMSPWGVCRMPVRARVCLHSARISKLIWGNFDCNRRETQYIGKPDASSPLREEDLPHESSDSYVVDVGDRHRAGPKSNATTQFVRARRDRAAGTDFPGDCGLAHDESHQLSSPHGNDAH